MPKIISKQNNLISILKCEDTLHCHKNCDSLQINNYNYFPFQNHITDTMDRINVLKADVIVEEEEEIVEMPLQLKEVILIEDGERDTLPKTDEELKSRLEKLCQEPGTHPFTNILDHWTRKSFEDLKLAEVASIVLAAPVSQITAEWALSALPLQITPIRNKQFINTMDDLLMVRLNSHILEKTDLL